MTYDPPTVSISIPTRYNIHLIGQASPVYGMTAPHLPLISTTAQAARATHGINECTTEPRQMSQKQLYDAKASIAC